MDKKITDAIEKLCSSLNELGIRVERVIIFGSCANGTADKNSDIDIAVISNDFKKIDIFRRLEILGSALAKAKIMEPIEALGYTEDEYNFEEKGSFINDEVKAKGLQVV